MVAPPQQRRALNTRWSCDNALVFTSPAARLLARARAREKLYGSVQPENIARDLPTWRPS